MGWETLYFWVSYRLPTDLQLLQTAGAAAGLAPERPREVDHLLARVVGQPDLEGADGAAAVPVAAAGVLRGLVDRLAHHVQHGVLVVSLESRERLQYLHLLLDQHLLICSMLYTGYRIL